MIKSWLFAVWHLIRWELSARLVDQSESNKFFRVRLTIKRRRAKTNCNHNGKSEQRYIIQKANEHLTKKRKLPEARENAGDQVAVGLSLVSDWLRGRCESRVSYPNHRVQWSNTERRLNYLWHYTENCLRQTSTIRRSVSSESSSSKRFFSASVMGIRFPASAANWNKVT